MAVVFKREKAVLDIPYYFYQNIAQEQTANPVRVSQNRKTDCTRRFAPYALEM